MSRARWYVTPVVLWLIVCVVSWKWGLLTFPFLLWHLAGSRRPTEAGWIYFLADEEHNRVKIGRTKNHPAARVARLAGQSPVPLKLVKAYETDNMVTEEAALHVQFNKCRVHGEWFDLSCVKQEIYRDAGML